ncbi:MAG: protease HtpX [Omnitrophica bacterium RIFCSPLOWO2_12_FULL_44_17]|uniref:Protease HtpX homolog n=1 Tax=Candidatus Danuiimicrobium aquiferis TaxID=1801832 RepID=A0A1G1KQQ2_9BACT|nr:MAG: protease HtpX [Omnitrophica bacterium RIFCSPHIGHO2_02_FULL_45_28]OGW95162.1 MAG: protease HtpX [Omnitrophica bacterium RIFCSPLOWO2_12_FULL_44_17]OGX01693.1 MAG: protease HtpX [Omnitrophica bacterium RIFCSPLOWO2_02_FULL_44_11]
MNTFKTMLLLTAMTLLFMFVGGAIGGRSGMMTAFMFACIMNLGSYWFSDKIVLAMYGAKPISEAEAPEIYRIVNTLSQRANVPMPKVYRIPTHTPNAFATGRNPQHAVVAVTDGILDILSEDELAGVLGHELGHVQHRDILIASLAATIAGAISMLASMARWAFMFGGIGGRDRENNGHPIVFLISAILAPIAAMMIQLAISRSREYEADKAGAQFCGNPLFLANALRKLDAGVKRFPMSNDSATTAHMFIVNPLRGGGLMSLFSTHPPIEERIARLEKMSYGG